MREKNFLIFLFNPKKSGKTNPLKSWIFENKLI